MLCSIEDFTTDAWELKYFVLSVIITGIGGWLTFREKSKDNESANKSNKLNIGGFVLIVGGALVGLFSGLSENSEKKIANHRVDSVNHLFVANDSELKAVQKEEKALLGEELDTSKYIVHQAQRLIDSLTHGLAIENQTNKTSGKILIKSNSLLEKQQRDSRVRINSNHAHLINSFWEAKDIVNEFINNPSSKTDSAGKRQEIMRLAREVWKIMEDEEGNAFLAEHKKLKDKWDQAAGKFRGSSEMIDGYTPHTINQIVAIFLDGNTDLNGFLTEYMQERF